MLTVSIAQSRLPLLQPRLLQVGHFHHERFNRSVAITVAATTMMAWWLRVQRAFQSLSRDYRCCNQEGKHLLEARIEGFNRSVAITVAATIISATSKFNLYRWFQSLSRDYRCCNEGRQITAALDQLTVSIAQSRLPLLQLGYLSSQNISYNTVSIAQSRLPLLQHHPDVIDVIGYKFQSLSRDYRCCNWMHHHHP